MEALCGGFGRRVVNMRVRSMSIRSDDDRFGALGRIARSLVCAVPHIACAAATIVSIAQLAYRAMHAGHGPR